MDQKFANVFAANYTLPKWEGQVGLRGTNHTVDGVPLYLDVGTGLLPTSVHDKQIS